MKLSFKLTFRFLIKAPLQSLLIIFTMLAGIASLLFLTTLFNSLDLTLDDIITNSLYHVRILKKSTSTTKGYLNYNEEHLNWITSNPEVKSAIYLKSYNNGFYYNGVNVSLALNLGSSDEIYNYFEATKIVNGQKPKENEIIIPETIRKQYNIELPVTIQYRINAKNYRPLTISGSYETKDRLIKQNDALGTYQSTSNQSLEKNLFDVLAIKLHNTSDLDNYLIKHEAFFKDPTITTSSFKNVSPTYQLIKNTQYIVLVFIQAFVALAIFMITASVISYSINQKRKQIGVLKVLGYQEKHLTRTFLIQSLILGIIASLIAYLLTDGGLRFFRHIMRDPQGHQRMIIAIDPMMYIFSFLLAFATIILATFYAIRKTRLNSAIELLKE